MNATELATQIHPAIDAAVDDALAQIQADPDHVDMRVATAAIVLRTVLMGLEAPDAPGTSLLLSLAHAAEQIVVVGQILAEHGDEIRAAIERTAVEALPTSGTRH